ncbi:class I SAM-dependent methyltransferase [Agromyces archimandritae]|uniref:LicD family protein n=1 Tax=Agromyces archimandritae TaxID=2781962 RepID=A0A975FQD3_9MICO|nr:class I SAM-dependent methyltransferase [Agromyces archimandritae]QTX05281.1 LicD family protein [Agromyces archimandritae]
MPALRKGRPAVAEISARGILFARGWSDRRFDVRFGGRRVWSMRSPEAPARGIGWPEGIRRHAHGRFEIDLVAAGDETPTWSGIVDFPGEGDGRLADAEGRPVVVNKWGRLVRSLVDDPEFQARLMTSLEAVIAVMRDLGQRPFITGGTLLGAVRSGAFLPHDDDADVGFLLEQSHPADVALETLKLQRELRERGFELRVHSRSHLQVLFADEAGDVDHYVDLFPGFTHEGLYCQPIAVRGPFEQDRLEPFVELELEGERMPSVADTAGWLELCYGPGWRTPDPSFRFETPPETRRRFENWFGVFNTNREFWDDAYADAPPPGARPAALPPLAAEVERLAPAGARIVDLGAGDGALARHFAARGAEVTAVEFSRTAIRAMRAADPDGRVETVEANLADGRDMLELAARLVRRPGPVVFVLSRLLAGLVPETRAEVFRLLRHGLEPGSFALADFGTELPPSYRHENPTSWHLPVDTLEDEARRAGLEVHVISQTAGRGGGRATATAMLRRAEQEAS